MIGDLTPTQRELAELMSRISEQMWRAGWMQGLEHELWAAMTAPAGKDGRLIPTQAQLDRLAQLSKDCGGWVVFDHKLEETFIPLGDWIARHAKWAAAST